MIPRSWLYVPGDRPEMLAKATGRGADALILDLEDGVAPSTKEDARESVATWLRDHSGGPGPEAWVRVNRGDLLGKDARAVLGPGLRGLFLPKVSSPDDITRARAEFGDEDVPIVALIETAAGILDAPAIASCPPVARLAIGEADLAADLGLDPSPDGLAPLRLNLVVASAAAGLDPPIGPVSRDFTDLDRLRDETGGLRRMGFIGRAAIHPAQVPVINEVFTPGREELDAARRLIARHDEAGGGVTLDDAGLMVDEAVIRAARRTLALAGEEGGAEG